MKFSTNFGVSKRGISSCFRAHQLLIVITRFPEGWQPVPALPIDNFCNSFDLGYVKQELRNYVCAIDSLFTSCPLTHSNPFVSVNTSLIYEGRIDGPPGKHSDRSPGTIRFSVFSTSFVLIPETWPVFAMVNSTDRHLRVRGLLFVPLLIWFARVKTTGNRLLLFINPPLFAFIR